MPRRRSPQQGLFAEPARRPRVASLWRRHPHEQLVTDLSAPASAVDALWEVADARIGLHDSSGAMVEIADEGDRIRKIADSAAFHWLYLHRYIHEVEEIRCRYGEGLTRVHVLAPTRRARRLLTHPRIGDDTP